MNPEPQVQRTLELLQTVAVIIGVLSVIGPVVIGALLWKISKAFVSKEDFNGLGSRVTAYETFAITTRERADGAHEKIRENEAALTVKLDWIRRDLDQLLRHADAARDRDHQRDHTARTHEED